jgi:uncharacterized protein
LGVMSRLVGRRYRLPAAVSRRIRTERNLRVPMRDGVTLLADRWYAQGGQRAPVVLIRSCYGRGALFGLTARLFAERGFQVILQSTRGSGGSGGRFQPFRQERADGLDTVRWVRSQAWFGDRLYTFGLSYLGYAQWAMAEEAGRGIQAMALHVTLSNFRNEILAFGGFTLDGSLGWTRTMSAMAAGLPAWKQALMLRSSIKRQTFDHLPLNELDRLVTGKEISWWQDWLNHTDPADPWWSEVDHSGQAEVIAPAVMIGGWHDIFLPWQIKDFEAAQRAHRNVWLTVGPWDHTASAGMAESLRQGLELFSADASGAVPFAGRDRVRLYVGGADQWRDYPCWPPPDSRSQRLYLRAGHGLSARAPEGESAPSSYIYDPSDPTPAVHGPRLFNTSGVQDMAALTARSDTLCFTSAPLTEDAEAIGAVSAELYVRTSAASADFYVCLCEVDRKGRALHIVDGYRRLRAHEASADPQAVRFVVLECWPTAHRFRRGHRLRLMVASGAHPRYARNLGTDALGSATAMLSSHQQILHDSGASSVVILTVRDPMTFEY